MDKKDAKALYYSALTLYLLAKYAEISTIYYTSSVVAGGLRYVRLLAYLLVIIYCAFYLTYTREELTKFMAVMSCVTITGIIVHSVTLPAAFLFVLAAKDIDKRELIKYVVILQSVTTIAIVIGCLCRVVPDWTYFISDRYRHSLGFFYPNRLSSIYFFIVISIYYLRGKAFNIAECVLLEAGNVAIFMCTNSRMAFALTTLALLMFLFVTLEDRMNIDITFNRNLYIFCIIIIPLICIACCWAYDPYNHILSRINGLISNRLLMGNNALLSKPITLFGHKNEWLGFGGLGYLYTELVSEYNAVDCSFVKVLLDNGIVTLTLVVAGYAMAIYYSIRKQDKFMCIVILLVFVYSMIEPNLIEIGFNPLVLCLSALVSPNGFNERTDTFTARVIA